MTIVIDQPKNEINGVPLYTRPGTPRIRFSENERIRMLGDSVEDLNYFADIFARRRGKHIVRRVRGGRDGDWRTVHHRVPATELTYHLLGDRLPGREPLWIGVFGWNYNEWMAIDVDHQGDDVEFQDRCQFVEDRLLVLGIPKTSLLILPTPSGGRHYYAFFFRRVSLDRVRAMLANVGLDHRPGLFEVYPDQNHGFRLPFGHVAYAPPGPEDWLNFVRRHRAGKFPRVNAKWCWRRSRAFAGKHGAGMFGNNNVFGASAASRERERSAGPHGYAKIGVGKDNRGGQRPSRGRVCRQHDHRGSVLPGSADDDRISSTAEAGELIKMGITEPGTRVELTKELAWHFVFVQGLAADEAKRRCAEWVYRTGRKTSKDVQVDLARGTRRVEKQTHQIVDWMIAQRTISMGCSQKSNRQVGFASAELDHLVRQLSGIPKTERRACGRFALEFLGFAKSCGRPCKGGWEASPSVRVVIRKWPGCSGKRYLPKKVGLEDVGLLVMTKEKLQIPGGRGRARTYLLRVPLVRAADCLLNSDQAWAELKAGLEADDVDSDGGT